MDGVKLRKVLSLNYKEGEKVKVSPVGDVVGLDGRMFKIDAGMLVDNILKNDIHIPLDENHYFGEAVGWFDKSSFEVREDGLYASLELNQKGSELVESKAYRYMSPVFIMNADNRVAELDSVGLVNRPNLLNKELNEKTNKEKKSEELEKLKEDVKTLRDELSALKVAPPPATEPKVEENNKQEIEVLKSAIKEMNSKMQVVFKKVELEENDKKVTLSENDKKVADLLGISHEDFLKSKEESK